MREELLKVEKAGTYVALAKWAERWRVKFQGTAGYSECLKQAWKEVERRQRPSDAARAANANG